LIVQIDSLTTLVLKNNDVICGEAFELSYDLIVSDESESLLNHCDEKTMEKKDIEVWELLDLILKHSKKLIFMDGDVSQRSLGFASSYGRMVYVNNKNNETKKSINLICNQPKWEAKMHKDMHKFYKDDRSVSQSSTQALSIEEDLKTRFPYLKVKRLIGLDSGLTKKEYFEDINKPLESTNVFIYSPVIESGVDITIPVKKIYGPLCSKVIVREHICKWKQDAEK
jgi:hypothetical protein